MKDGQIFSESTVAPKGSPVTNPMSREEIKAKFRANVDFSKTLTKENAEKLLVILEKADELDSVNRMGELLVP